MIAKGRTGTTVPPLFIFTNLASQKPKVKTIGRIAREMWYDLYGNAVAEEAVGDGFLNREAASLANLKTAQTMRTVNNVLGHFGGDKPKRGTEEFRRAKYDELCSVLDFVASLTNNHVESIALPIAVNKIRDYKLDESNYDLPPYTTEDTVSYIPSVLKQCAEGYARYLEEDERLFKKDNKNAYYMPRVSFGTLKPIIGRMIRYCMHYWHLNPWRTREQAYKESLEFLWNNWENKGTITKTIITNMLHSRVKDLMLRNIKSQGRVPAATDNTKTMFLNNEDAQALLRKYTKLLQVKCPIPTFDFLEDLRYYVSTLKKQEDKDKYKFIEDIVVNETLVYKERVAQHQAKLDRAAQKEAEQEKKKIANQEKQRQKIEESKRIFAEEEKKKEAAKTMANLERQAAAPPAEANSEGGDKEGQDQNNGAPAPPHEPGQSLEDMLADLPDVSEDPLAIFKLEYNSTTILEQRSCGSKRKASSPTQEDIDAPIVKSITNLIAFKVAVTYTKPGAYWVDAINFRFGNLYTAIVQFNTINSSLVQKSLKRASGDLKWYDRIVLAIMLHNGAKKKLGDKWYDEVGIAENFHEPNFLLDIQNTISLWSNPIIVSSNTLLKAFYNLWCCLDDIDDKTNKERQDLFWTSLDNTDVITKAVGNQVKEICCILSGIVQEMITLEGGGTWAKKKNAFDPFQTTTPVFDH